MQHLPVTGARRTTAGLTEIILSGAPVLGMREITAVHEVRAYAEAQHSHSRGEPSFPVVAIGASAGGLEAFRTLLAALPANSGMAFILVQHLDPTHASMMVELLSPHTAMTVLEARDGLRLEPDHVYIIPPGRYLAVHDGAIQLSRPAQRTTVRMPFDFLLQSLAEGVR